METIVNQLTTTLALLKLMLPTVLMLLAILWIIHIINWILGYRLNLLGIYPRSTHGFIGIIFSPFLHGDFNHLFFNSIPLFVLTGFVLLNGWQTFIYVTLFIILVSGFLVWLLGRPAIHIGASGVVMGYWSYLMMNAFQQGTAVTIALAAVCIFYFGGLVINLFPRFRTSWEAHVFGFFAGIAAAYVVPILLKN
jgi:membrane associated rhomboid family serine protease